MGHSDRLRGEGDGGRWDGRAANLSFDLRLGFTTGEIYSDTNAHKVALWLAKPTGARGLLGRRICVASSRIYLTSLRRRRAAAGGDLNTLGGV